MVSYTKLFSDILASSIWGESDTVRIVWITMLAMPDRDGVVGASLPGLAHLARVSIAACTEALRILAAPDEHSRTQDHEGRRIEAVDGGWRILNYERHRDRASADEAREKAAARQRRKRERDAAKKPKKVTPPVTPRNENSRLSLQADAEAEADAKGTADAPSAPLSPSGPDTGTPSSCRKEQDECQGSSGPAGPSGTEGQRHTDDEVEQVVLFKSLWATSYRRNSQNRHMDVTDAVVRLHAAGIAPADLLTLAQKAERRGAKPSGLFAHWIDTPDEALKELGKRS